MSSETERSNNRQPPWEPPESGESVSFGTWLRRQREMREIPLREIADVTKISIRYLEALEQDRFDVLPAPVFAKGFLREYARYVGLDPDEVVNSYLTAQRAVDRIEEAVPPEPARRRFEWTSGWLLGLGVVILLALVTLLILFADRSRERRREELPAIAAPPAPVVVEPPPAPEPEPEPAVPLVVTMDFTEDCWVEASVDGERRISELHVQGESMRIEAATEVLLTLGNPAGVRIEVNGVPFQPDFRPGRVARDIAIDLETAAELGRQEAR